MKRAVVLVLFALGCGSSPREKAAALADDHRALQEDMAERQRRGLELAQRAAAAQEAGRTDEAIGLYRDAINTWNRTPGAYHNLGLLLIEKGDATAAVDAFSIEADQNPRDPRPLYMLGKLYLDKGWPEDALKAFDRALKRDPNFLNALRGYIGAADLLRRADQDLMDYIRRAMLMETDPEWSAYMARQRYRVEQEIERR